MLVKNGDSWSYPHLIVLVGHMESAFLMIPQVILVPMENCLALSPGCITEPFGKLIKNLASILSKRGLG